jgi:hypothetical protein
MTEFIGDCCSYRIRKWILRRCTVLAQRVEIGAKPFLRETFKLLVFKLSIFSRKCDEFCQTTPSNPGASTLSIYQNHNLQLSSDSSISTPG